MMEKIELKHLAPYLSYGTKVLMNDGLVYWLSDKSGIVRGEDYLHSVSIADCIINPCKLILRPLSDLDKYGKIRKDVYNEFTEHGKYMMEYDSPLEDSIHALCWGDFDTLIKYHFDVFGLIEKDLAIDINTLNNE